MQQLKFLVLTGFLSVATGFLASASSQTPTIPYKIVWHGPKNTALIGAYSVFEQDGLTVSKAFNDQFPKEIELSVSPTATVTASGSSAVDTHIRVRIYQNGKVCNEAVTYSKGSYATVFCSPP